MKRSKMILLLVLFIPLILVLNLNFKVKADSGFDTSYDSGGWSSSDSGWSSSSSWDYSSSSYDYSSSSSYSYSGDSSIFGYFVFFVMMIIFLTFIFSIEEDLKSKRTRHGGSNYYVTPKYLTDAEVRKFIPDFNYHEFINARFQDYLDIQNAWMLFDYETLKTKLTDELYNQYVFQLDSMKIKREQNIMSDFELVKGNITNIKNNNGRMELTMEMVVSFYDYIIKDSNVVRGSKDRKVTIYYEITFVCSDGRVDNKCPNCHATLNNSSSQVCEYCRTTINRVGKDWVMAKKTNRKQD